MSSATTCRLLVASLQLAGESPRAGAEIHDDRWRELEEIESSGDFISYARLQNRRGFVGRAGAIERMTHTSSIEARGVFGRLCETRRA